VYRPYLGFLYLNNAYHFYSPEPGPPTLLWYRVEYASGKTQWFRIPDRSHDRNPLHYQRILALTESMNQLKPAGMLDEGAWMELKTRRRRAGFTWNIPDEYPGDQRVPQYAEPQDISKIMTAAYARHLARTTVNPDDPDDKVVRVRMYRVIHVIIGPDQMAQGVSPTSPWLYIPYFQGEFDAEGNLVDPDDPFLYWIIPIYRPDPRNSSIVVDSTKQHDLVPSRVPVRKEKEKETLQP
jgi:hypothetical protein